MSETIQAVHEQGGLAVVAHPLSPWCPSASLTTLAKLTHFPDGIEVHNASFAGVGSNGKVRKVNNQRFGWAELGGSDAHSLSAISSSFTTFPGTTIDDMLAAIHNCTTVAHGKFWPKRAVAHYTYRKVRGHIPSPRSMTRRVRARIPRIRRAA
jgi:hypothetical protein